MIDLYDLNKQGKLNGFLDGTVMRQNPNEPGNGYHELILGLDENPFF